MFLIDPAFEAASEPLTDLALCAVRLQRDARFPWLLLIPRRAGLTELEDLPEPGRAWLATELVAAGRAVRAIGEALGRPVAKLNIAALGNVTPQLHWHVVGRRRDDPCWPGPVWGQGEPVAYAPDELATARAAAARILTTGAVEQGEGPAQPLGADAPLDASRRAPSPTSPRSAGRGLAL